MAIARKIRRFSIGFVSLFLLYVAVILIHGSLTNYSPPPVLPLSPHGDVMAPNLPVDSSFRIISWNIGYAGLGAEATFFYSGGGFFTSGGRMVHPTQALNQQFTSGILDLLSREEADFYLLQEVDRESSRSYFANQHELIEKRLAGTVNTFAVNYDVKRVPAPILQPWSAYGKTLSGLSTFSRHHLANAERISLPGRSAWPTHLFQLDRCVAVHDIPLENGKKLILVNVHNAAFDKTGAIRAMQMKFLKELLQKEYEAGHYVIAGGDWNQSPPFFDNQRLNDGRRPNFRSPNMPPELFPDTWQWIYDPTQATVRDNSQVYNEQDNYVRLIDYFLISPNVQALKVRCIDQQFRFSDHQPVSLEFRLQP
ncbi:MAG: endonuclease/exonuclease/phosphatase family protein [Bacteroidota bacterium]